MSSLVCSLTVHSRHPPHRVTKWLALETGSMIDSSKCPTTQPGHGLSCCIHVAYSYHTNSMCSAPEDRQQVELQLLQAQALQVNKGNALGSSLGTELQPWTQADSMTWCGTPNFTVQQDSSSTASVIQCTGVMPAGNCCVSAPRCHSHSVAGTRAVQG